MIGSREGRVGALDASKPGEWWRVALAVLIALASVPLLVLDNRSAGAERGASLVATVAEVPPADVAAPPAAAAPAVAAVSEPTVVEIADLDDRFDRASSWSAAYVERSRARLDEAVALGEQVEALNSLLDDRAAAEARALAQAAAAEAAPPPAPTAPPTTAAPAPSAPPPSTTTTVAPTTTTTVDPVPVAPDPGDGPTPEQWAALRECESSGNYAAINSTGKYRGAYQFSQATWDWIASIHYPHLVGVDPAAASPADQDAMAAALYRTQGPDGAWPNCAYVFS